MHSVTPLSRPRLRQGLAFVLAFFLFAVVRAADAPDKKSFNLPADAAEKTLKLFSEQSGRGVVFLSARVRGIRTNPVRGQLTPREALDRMMEGTMLVASLDEKTGAFAIRRETADPNAPRAIAQVSDRPQSPTTRSSERPATRPAASDAESVLTLSPFEVRPEEDNGYQATSTLMGTRLRSELKDLPASISVVTKDYMRDINAKDLTSLFIYTLGTEVGGLGGNYSGLSDPAAGGVYDDALGQATPATRVRGLLSADAMRDYFLTDLTLDGYNTDRVEISRGPNAMLFGLGSPAGIYNRSVIKADLRRPRTNIDLQDGSFGSYRATLDTNQTLLRGKLAVRLATVYDRAQFEQEFTFDKKRAVTLTATWRPFENTVIKASTEYGRDDSNKPEPRPPYDQITFWWAMGQPVWNPVTNTGRLLGTPQAPFTGANLAITATGARNGNFISSTLNNLTANAVGIVYQDPNSSVLGGLPIGGGQVVDAFKGAATNGTVNSTGTALVNQLWASIAAGVNVTKFAVLNNAPVATLYSYNPQITDPRIFDFYHHSLEGPMKYEFSEWKTYSLTLEQTFLERRAGFELALDRQFLDNGYNSPINYSLNVDLNEVLPNGAPNPNFLRPTNAGSGFKRIYSKDRDAGRISAYYDLDLRRVGGPRWLGQVLGRHVFNVNHTRQQAFAQVIGGTLWNIGTEYAVAEAQTAPGTVSSTARIVPVIEYYGPSLRNATSAINAGIQGLTASHDPSGVPAVSVLYQARPANTTIAANQPWTTRTFGLVTDGRERAEAMARNAGGYVSRTEQQVNSTAATLQSHWLENTIVTTAGWRRDQAWSYDAGLPANNPALGNADLRWEVWYPKLTTVLGEDSTNWGVVGHLPQFARRHLPFDSQLSVFYNQASNFRVAAQRYNVLGQPVGPETGDSKEYGIRLSAFGGKLEFKFAHYDTLADKATVNNNNFVAAVNQLADMLGLAIERTATGANSTNPNGLAALDNWINGPYGQIYRKTFHYTLNPNTDPTKPIAEYGKYSGASWDRGNVVGTSALESKGLEFELVYNPTSRWRIRASAGRDDAIRTNIAPELNDFLNNAQNGVVPLVLNPDLTPTAVGNLSTTVSGNPNTLANVVRGNVVTPMDPIFRQAGSRTDELRRWHWSAVTNYSFSPELFGGRLQDFSIGGGVRWMDKIAIGYPATTFINSAGASVPILDVFHPYFGPAETYYDANVGYTHRFRRFTWNARLYCHNIGVGDQLIPVYANPDGNVAYWRIADRQTWTLSSSFSF